MLNLVYLEFMWFGKDFFFLCFKWMNIYLFCFQSHTEDNLKHFIIIIIYFSCCCLLSVEPFRVYTDNHLPPPQPISTILLCHIIPVLLLLHYVLESSLKSSSSSPAFQLNLQHPLSGIATIPPLYKFKPSQSCLCWSLGFWWHLFLPIHMLIVLKTTKNREL